MKGPALETAGFKLHFTLGVDDESKSVLSNRLYFGLGRARFYETQPKKETGKNHYVKNMAGANKGKRAPTEAERSRRPCLGTGTWGTFFCPSSAIGDVLCIPKPRPAKNLNTEANRIRLLNKITASAIKGVLVETRRGT